MSFERSYSVIIPGKLAVMNRPGMYCSLQEDLDFLKEQGIGAIVSLTVSSLDTGPIESAGMTYLHEPVTDFTPPSREQLERIVEFIDHQHQQGCVTLVHCGAGLGRSGTVAAACLVRTGMGAVDAIRHVRELRPFSIETSEQEEAIARFARKCRE